MGMEFLGLDDELTSSPSRHNKLLFKDPVEREREIGGRRK
jgi:hypothetical protein